MLCSHLRQPVKPGLTVIACVTAEAGHQQQLRDALLDLVTSTRTEAGCINYDLHQSEENSNEFAIHENWESAANLTTHAKSVHLQTFTRIAGDLLVSPAQIKKWKMISEPQRAGERRNETSGRVQASWLAKMLCSISIFGGLLIRMGHHARSEARCHSLPGVVSRELCRSDDGLRRSPTHHRRRA